MPCMVNTQIKVNKVVPYFSAYICLSEHFGDFYYIGKSETENFDKLIIIYLLLSCVLVPLENYFYLRGFCFPVSGSVTQCEDFAC